LLIHNHKYQSEASKEEILILEQTNLDKDCKTWE